MRYRFLLRTISHFNHNPFVPCKITRGIYGSFFLHSVNPTGHDSAVTIIIMRISLRLKVIKLASCLCCYNID